MKRAVGSPLATPAIEEIWRRTAERVGFAITRTTDAYATSDGRGVIAIGATATLDDDDALAQLIFHELCHAITEGEQSLTAPDWGLDNVPEHAVREHACLRVMARLADGFGLRALMAPTTPYREYYAAIPLYPLESTPGDHEAADLATAACARFDASAWRAPIEQALAETVAALGLVDSKHPLGFELGPRAESCGTCAWLYDGGRGPAVPRCRQSAPADGEGARTARSHPACAHWEPPVDCRNCGAYYREAYHSVTVTMRDPVVWQEPHLIVRHGPRFEILREGSRCAALHVGEGHSYTCTIYQNRPRPCREFSAGGRHCIEARRRVGLTPTPAARPTGPRAS